MTRCKAIILILLIGLMLLFVPAIHTLCYKSKLFRTELLDVDYITIFSTIIAILFGILVPYSMDVLRQQPIYISAQKNGLWSSYIKEKTYFISASGIAIFFLISMCTQFFLEPNIIISTVHFCILVILLCYTAWFVSKIFTIASGKDKESIKSFLEISLIKSLNLPISSKCINDLYIVPTEIMEVGKSIMQHASRFEADNYKNEVELLFYVLDNIDNHNATDKLRLTIIIKILYLTNWEVSVCNTQENKLVMRFVDRLIHSANVGLISDNPIILRAAIQKLDLTFSYLCNCISYKNSKLAYRNSHKWIFSILGLSYEITNTNTDVEIASVTAWKILCLSFLAALIDRSIFDADFMTTDNMNIIRLFHANKDNFLYSKLNNKNCKLLNKYTQNYIGILTKIESYEMHTRRIYDFEFYKIVIDYVMSNKHDVETSLYRVRSHISSNRRSYETSSFDQGALAKLKANLDSL